MQINYCDLCAGPMKDGQSYILYIATPQELKGNIESHEDLEHYINKVKTDEKEICPTCKHLFDRIFYHRLEGMAALTEECVNMFGLPYPLKPAGKILDKPTELKKKKGKK